ncbi:kinase-like protein [Ceratobasidium sp. AG-I]|nr:kinase-like protein [Ceratobasidium sp. AG-I]
MGRRHVCYLGGVYDHPRDAVIFFHDLPIPSDRLKALASRWRKERRAPPHIAIFLINKPSHPTREQSAQIEGAQLSEGNGTGLRLSAGQEDAISDISQEVQLFGSWYDPHAYGGFCDVFLGQRGPERVAIKRLRALKNAPEVVKKRFFRECDIWKKLRHPNILEFYGIAKHGGSLFMISPFLAKGDAPSWLASRSGERLRVLLDVAMGCLYLHNLTTQPIVHGDLKGGNILVKDDGQAVVSDFGLSKLKGTFTSLGLKGTGTIPYIPELCPTCDDLGENNDDEIMGTKTLETDVFAFGRTAIELLSGERPYGERFNIAAVLGGRRPPRPKTDAAKQWITDEMWEFINEMTHVQPRSRPTMGGIERKLKKFYNKSN